MDKNFILAEIRRIARENGGVPPGRQLLSNRTEISQSDWYPHIWLRWSDAIREAGFEPNKLQDRIGDFEILEKYAAFVREIGHIPVSGEIRLKSSSDASFPAHSAFSRFGSKWDLLEKLVNYIAEQHLEYDDVVQLCRNYLEVSPRKTLARPAEPKISFGFVYLMKAGKHYKIGRTRSLEKREREIGLIVPELRKTIHWIETDDPSGVEAYWHRRFGDKRGNGEWFNLSAEDVAAFKRWKRIA